MKVFRRNKGITIVSLVVTIIILIILAGVSINTLFSENGIITMTKKAKENVELAQVKEQTELNELYEKLEKETGDTGGISYDAIAKLIEFKKVIAEAITNKGIETKETDSVETMADNITKLQTNTEGTAESSDIISGKTAWVNGIQLTGTMTNNGAKTATLNAGGSYTIPAGYHNGSGKITANSLASQTSASATAADILSGKTAWVKGIKLTGTMTDNGAKTASLKAGGSYTIPAGYHNGSGKITANSLASQTSASATAADILSGKTAWVNGKLVTGTNNGGSLIQSSDNRTIPQGVKKAYIVAVHLTNYNNNWANISGSIVKSTSVISIPSVIESNVVAALAEIIEIDLTGNEGTISVTFSGGSGAILKDDYTLFYIK